jgi:Fur family zinc uptake transcriptional regulator
MEAGVVHRLESKNAFFACRIMHNKGRRQLIMSCEQCGKVDEVDGDIIFETIDKVVRKAGFEPRVKFVEVSGVCSTCAEKV